MVNAGNSTIYVNSSVSEWNVCVTNSHDLANRTSKHYSPLVDSLTIRAAAWFTSSLSMYRSADRGIPSSSGPSPVTNWRSTHLDFLSMSTTTSTPLWPTAVTRSCFLGIRGAMPQVYAVRCADQGDTFKLHHYPTASSYPINLRRSTPARPSIPEPNSMRLLGSGVVPLVPINVKASEGIDPTVLS
jgi:hypothetical protein